MKSGSSKRKHSQTPFVLLDKHKCNACWKCIEKCSHDVIGKVNILWHKHAHIVKGDNCTGCLKCVNVCENNALSKVLNGEHKNIIQ